jgi:oryzin
MIGLKRLALYLGAIVPIQALPFASPKAEAVPGKYIVTLKEGIFTPQIETHLSWVNGVHARSISRRDTSGVDKVWTQSFKGYSGEFDAATLEAIKNNEEVSLGHMLPMSCKQLDIDSCGFNLGAFR